jgi:RNA-binding protein
MKLTAKQKRHLRTLSHNRKPVVIIGGGGLTQNVLDEIKSSIEHHELIKVRINASDRSVRKDMIEKIVSEINCELIFAIGHVATFYRKSNKSLITFPR